MRLFASLLITTFITLCSSYDVSAELRAFACTDCSYNKAKQIALAEAPTLNCSGNHSSPFAPPGAIELCDPVEEKLIVAVNDTQVLYAFDVMVTKNSYGQDVTQIFDASASAAEVALMDKYFDTFKALESAINEYNQMQVINSNSSNKQKVRISSLMASSQNDAPDCSAGHPLDYFKNLEAKKNIEQNIRQDIHGILREKDTTITEMQNDGLNNGGGFNISLAGFGGNISLQYVEKKLVASKFYGPDNFLVFNINPGADVTDTDTTGYVGLTLNSVLSQVDGNQFNNVFNGGNLENGGVVDLTASNLSPCTWEFFKNLDKVELPGSGGSGTRNDPHYGPGSSSLPGICLKTVRQRTCSAGPGGNTCTVTYFHFVENCGTGAP